MFGRTPCASTRHRDFDGRVARADARLAAAQEERERQFVGLRSTTRAIFGRWYVSAALMAVLGVALGYYVFFNVYPGRPQIGVIDIPFTIIDEDAAFLIGEMLDYARRDNSIKGVVIKLVTPGGGVAESETLYLKTASLREEKPVVVATGWMSASGGMLWSMGANFIYAEAASTRGQHRRHIWPGGRARVP